jgi:hypothetical protein
MSTVRPRSLVVVRCERRPGATHPPRRDRFLPRPNGSGRVRDDPQRIQTEQTREETMNDLQAIADRFEIEALRGEFTDAAMMRH